MVLEPLCGASLLELLLTHQRIKEPGAKNSFTNVLQNPMLLSCKPSTTHTLSPHSRRKKTPGTWGWLCGYLMHRDVRENVG
jgi:hypothetical protein